MTAYADRRRNDNIAESNKMVADALESMDGSVKAQDKAIGEITKIARSGIADATTIASAAESKAAKAERIAQRTADATAAVSDRVGRIENLTLLERMNFFFRGQLP